jgi:hypothetical protein
LALALIAATSIGWAAAPPASELAARWWQWVLEIPAAQNPLLDTTGEFAAVGQSGPVWFLAGTWGGGPATRRFTVPAGKPLFFPIVNYFACGFLHAPGLNSDYPPGPIAYERAMCKEFIDTVTYLACEVDGVAIQITQQNREQSVPFALYLPAGNVFQEAPTWSAPGVDEGYYVLLAPLARGQHTIRFAAAGPDFSLEVTDYITVQ